MIEGLKTLWEFAHFHFLYSNLARLQNHLFVLPHFLHQSANLQSAARKGDAETLGSLLDQGADINIKDAKGVSGDLPLYCCTDFSWC